MFALKLTAADTPIELIDQDGLREVARGRLGAYPFVCCENPVLVSLAIAEKARRSMIRGRNIQAFT